MEELIYKKLLEIVKIPYKKIILFGKITDTNYEMFFFVNDGKKDIQCYQLTESGQLDENAVDNCFSEIAKVYRESENFKKNKLLILSFEMNNNSIVEYKVTEYEKTEKVYKLKKNWLEEHNIRIV